MESLADSQLKIFVEYHGCADPSLQLHLQQMSHSQLDSLVQELHFQNEDSQQLILSIRFLFSFVETRVRALIRCVRLLQLSVCDRTAMQILPELNSAIVESCNSANYTDKEINLFVRDILKVILSPLQEIGISSQDVMKRFAHAFEVISTLLECLPTTDEDREASCTRKGAMEMILDPEWPSAFVVPITKALLDSILSLIEQQMIREKVQSLLNRIKDENLIGILDTAIAMAEKYEDPRWFDIVRKLMDKAPVALVNDACCVIEISFQTSPKLVWLLICTLSGERGKPSSSKSKDQSRNSRKGLITASDLMLLLLAAHNDIYKDHVIQSLVNAIIGNIELGDRNDERTKKSISACKEVLEQVVCRSEAASQTGLLLDIAVFMLHSCQTISDGGAGAELGECLVLMLYIRQPHSRPAVLKAMFSALVENRHRDNLQMTFMRILRTICRKYLISLREYAQVCNRQICILTLSDAEKHGKFACTRRRYCMVSLCFGCSSSPLHVLLLLHSCRSPATLPPYATDCLS